MKRRFIVAMFLAAVLVLSLGGCGSSSGTAVPAVENDNYASDTAEPAQGTPQENAGGGYSAEGLFNLWARESFSEEEIQAMVAAGEISNEAYEEFLIIKSEYLEANASTEEELEEEEATPQTENPTVDTSVLELLTTRSVEFEDMDGYKIRETCQVSPIFTEDDMETMHALWVALGNDIEIFPSYESMFDPGHRDSCDRLEYIIGTYMVENLTDGFSIVADNPRSYDGVLVPIEDGDTPAIYKEYTATHFRYDVVTMVPYSNKIAYYSSGTKNAGLVCDVKMESDTWGPCAFIMAVPNCSTPNQPDGYRYDELTLVLCGNHHMKSEEFVTFDLDYYSKGGK